MDSTVPVIIPVYNLYTYLPQCMKSVLSQSYSNLQVMLINDGATDTSGTICDDYATKYSRVVVIHQEDGGISSARNAGIDWAFANSDSQWLSFIDSDDWVHPEYLQRLLDAAVEYNVAVSICGYLRTGGEELEIEPEMLVPVIWKTECFYTEHNVNAIIAWGKLYQKECFLEIRYPEGRLHEDEFITYKILFAFDSVAVISAPLYAYYINSESIILSAWSPRRMDALDAYSERLLFFQQHNREDLFHQTLATYIWYIIAMRNKVLSLQNADFSKKYAKVLLRRLRRVLVFKKQYLPISKFAGAYELAFPHIMRLYWIAKSQFKKIIRLLKVQ